MLRINQPYCLLRPLERERERRRRGRGWGWEMDGGGSGYRREGDASGPSVALTRLPRRRYTYLNANGWDGYRLR